jgi:uncharacterized protein with von Willebrand factor type A (vWA) domain
VSTLPLLNLFNQLRNAGLPLNADDYAALLEALRSGFGLEDRTALARLCCTLWVKSKDEQRIFDYYFDLEIGSVPVAVSEPVVINGGSMPPEPAEPSPRSVRWKRLLLVFLGVALAAGGAIAVYRIIAIRSATLQPLQPLPTQQSSSIEAQNKTSPGIAPIAYSIAAGILSSAAIFLILPWLARQVSDRWVEQEKSGFKLNTKSPDFTLASDLPKQERTGQIGQIILQAPEEAIQMQRHLRDFADEYFPVTRRQMKQSWRFLRHRLRSGIATQVDITATVKQVGQQGFFLKPVLMPRRINLTELLILIDHGGSMAPFQDLSARLVETTRQGGRLGKVQVLYFRNCPTDILFRDVNLQTAEPLVTVLTQLHSRRTMVLIVSDAGAARGTFNLNRIDQTEEFLIQLRQQVSSIAWLNPTPRKRWLGTTAAEIAYAIPMFEMSRSGLNQAIHTLQRQFKGGLRV